MKNLAICTLAPILWPLWLLAEREQCGVEQGRPSWPSAQSKLDRVPSNLYCCDSLKYTYMYNWLSLSVVMAMCRTFEPVNSMLVSGKVNKMRSSHHGVWVSFRSSTTLALYDSLVYVKLMEVDYTSLCPPPAVSSNSKVHILTLYYS